MKSKSRRGEHHPTDELCAHPHEEDGIPPSVLRKRRQNEHRHINYHGEQLCKQVRIALAEALICDCADPSLADLEVLQIRMASGTSVLEALVTAPDQDQQLLQQIERRLRRAEGWLRASVGDAIHRKRLPHLKFKLMTRD